MKKSLRFLALALVLVMAVCALCACPDPGENPTDKYANIAGEYYLDAAELGMPMAWYVKITADGNFTIANKRDYSVAANIKGEGTIGEKDGTYMFLYKDSTPDAPKSATFTVDKGGNLVFSTAVPIGAATISPKVEGDVTTNPIAKIIGAEEHLGTYMGEYLKSSPMAGDVLYSYELTLDYGYAYKFVSSFEMGGESYVWTETGIFAVDGTKITFTADSEGATPAEGTIADKKITAAFRLSMMGKTPQEVTAELAPYADVAGQYSTHYVKDMSAMGMGVMDYTAFLTLKGNGDYSYICYKTADLSATPYTESGKFTMDGTAISFTAEGATTAISGTLENYTISGADLKFAVSSMGGGKPALTFYAECAQGVFNAKASTEGDTPVEYAAILRVFGNEFSINVSKVADGAAVYELKGTFVIEKSMGAVTMNMTATSENPIIATAQAAVSKDGINIELPFDANDSTKLGFQFEQSETLYKAFTSALNS